MINPKDMSTDAEYFADKSYMSVSKYKQFLKCEVGGLEDFGEPSEAMLIGSYVDAYISGTLDEFKESHPEIISSRGATKGELKAGFKKADEIIKYIDANPTFKQFMEGDKQTVMTGEIFGVPFKGKLDVYAKGIAINDLKVLATVTDKGGNYYDFVSAWNYDLQMSVYQELVFQNTDEKLPTFLCVATKEEPINSVIVNVDQTTLDVALYRLEENVKRFYDIMQGTVEPVGCGICSSCIAQRVDTPIIGMMDLLGL